MKRIWNAIGKTTKDTHFRANAVKQFEKIESGSVKVAAPKVPREQKRFETAQEDLKVKEELVHKNKTLVDNMEKITIHSIDPPKKENPVKPLPSRESEWEHRNDPIWEFGFYEPPADKIPKGKLLLREALEILRAKQETNVEGSDPTAAKRRELGKEEYKKVKAVSRLEPEFIGDMYEYFRPFERKDHQKVVKKKDLADLQDYLKGHTKEAKLTDGAKEHVQEMLKRKVIQEEYDRLDDQEKQQFGEAVRSLRSEEQARLMERLKQINEIEDGIKKAQEAAKAPSPKEETK